MSNADGKKVFFSNITSMQNIPVNSKRKTILYEQLYRHHFQVKLGGKDGDVTKLWEAKF